MDLLFRVVMRLENGLVKLHVDKPQPGLPVQLSDKGPVGQERRALSEQ